MIRFSLRNRARDCRRDPADRPNKPPGKTIPARPPPSSFLANYDTLPSRRPDGLALDYFSYHPSSYSKPQSAHHPLRRHDPPTPSNATSITDLGLDFDSVQRSQPRPFDPLDFIPLEKRIQSKITQLRSYLQHAENLGDIEVLKDLVGIHDATLNNHTHAAHLTRMQIKEAKIIAGISDPSPPYPDVEHTSIPIRKVPGNPIRHISGRTLSALKARSAVGRSGQRAPTRVSTDRYRDHVNRARNHSNFGRGKEVAKLSRKSSARLKRLGSAGSVLIRRLSKVSVAEDSSTGSSNDAPVSSTFDQDTMKRLRSAPGDVIGEYENELRRLEQTIEAETGKLREAKERLESRRLIHSKAMQILDQFYGGLPGWEEDPIARSMLQETAEMTEAGLEAERDLADARLERERAQAAFEDHERCLRELQFIAVTLNTFIRQVEDMMMIVEQLDLQKKFVKMQSSGLEDALAERRGLLGQCIEQARIAVDCSVEAPRVSLLERDLKKVGEAYSIEAGAVSRQGGLRRGDFSPSLQVARSALCDCRLAESFVAARVKMVGEDLAKFDMRMERCEEYVMLERVGILDQYHPA